MSLHPVIERVTTRIAERSRDLRDDYLSRMEALRTRNPEHVATVIHEHNQRALDTYIAHLQKTGDVTV